MAQEETFQTKKIFEERRNLCIKKQRRVIAMVLVIAFAFALMAICIDGYECFGSYAEGSMSFMR